MNKLNFDDIQIGDVFRVKTIGELKDFYKDKEEDFDEYKGTSDFPGFVADMIKFCGSEVVVDMKYTATECMKPVYVVNAKGWAWRPEWLVPIKTIANNIDIEKVNDLI